MRRDKEGTWLTWDEWKAHQLDVAFATGKEGVLRRQREEQEQSENERREAIRRQGEMRRLHTRQERMNG